MRVLFVSHTYTAPMNRQKLLAINAIPGVELGLIMPSDFHDPLMKSRYEFARLPGEDYPILRARAFFAGNIFRHFYSPSVIRFLRAFRPDIIHVEQESWSASLFQMAVLRDVFSRSSKLLFFGWQNIVEKYSLPYSLFERYSLKRMDYAVVGNGEAGEVLRAKGFQKPVKMLPQLGLDPAFYRRRDSSALRGRLGLDAFVVGFVGRLIDSKGVATVVEAVKKLGGNAQLLLVGRGDQKPQLEEEAESLGVRAVFVDSVRHEEVPDYLSCMDVLVLPSRTTKYWKEQFGRVLVEAMACEVPVIGSSSGAIPEVIGDAGLVFAEGNAGELAAQLGQCRESATLRATLVERGRRRVMENYTHERIARETYVVYEEIMSK